MTSLYSLNEKIDQVMIERIGDPDLARLNSGLYAASYRWLEAFQMYLWTVLPVFFARFAFFQKDPGKLRSVFAVGQVVSAVPMIFISVFVFFYAEKLFWLFDHSNIEEIEVMSDTTRVLFLTALSNGFFAVYGSFISCLGFEKKVSYYIIISIILNVALNAYFIPLYGPVAAASATLISNVFLSIVNITIVIRNFEKMVPFELLAKLFLLLLFVATGFLLFNSLGLHWLLVTFIVALLVLLLSYVLGFFRLVLEK
jgi:O-antigen/teichoic acid export membrane protein